MLQWPGRIASWSDLGPANPNAINAPGGGVTEVVDLVRVKVRDVLRALEVDSREVGDRGYQQGFASPTTFHRRRIALGMRLWGAFLTLWRRITVMLAVTGRPQLHDNDKGCPVNAMSPMYPLRIYSQYKAKTSVLVFVFA